MISMRVSGRVLWLRPLRWQCYTRRCWAIKLITWPAVRGSVRFLRSSARSAMDTSFPSLSRIRDRAAGEPIGYRGEQAIRLGHALSIVNVRQDIERTTKVMTNSQRSGDKNADEKSMVPTTKGIAALQQQQGQASRSGPSCHIL